MRRFRLRIAVLALCTSAACGRSCDPLGSLSAEVRNAVDTLDRSIDSLVTQSADWQVVLADLESTLVRDLRSTLRNEATDLARNGVHGSGVELRCDSEFFARRAARELTRVRNDIARDFNDSTGRGPKDPGIDMRPEPSFEPFVCSSVPSAVDLGLAAERRVKLDVYGFDLRAATISAEVVDVAGRRRNVTAALGVISDFHMVLDLTGGGANPAVPDSRAVFSWNGASQSVVPILSPTADPAACRERTILVPGAPQGPFVPRHRRGDFDFVGHGPCVRLRALLRTDAENTRLSANVLMEAFECDEEERPQSDYTRVFESTSFDLFTVPAPGTTIVSHNYTQPRFTDDYRDGGHPDDIRTFVSPAMIEKIIYVGDTYGDEAGSRTGATMFFRELRVVVQECGPPASPPPG